MIKLTLLIPFLGLTTFGGYYHHWDAAYRARTTFDPGQPLARYAHRDGREDAANDLLLGTRRILTYGAPATWQSEYDGLLSRIYRIERKSLADGPEVPDAVKAYIAAYNEVMEREIVARYGPAVFRETREMAASRHAINERVRQYVPPL